MNHELHKVSVENNIRLGLKGHYLSFYRTFEFKPGQVIGITIDPRIPPRLYSIASDNRSQFAEILYTVKEDGEVTPHLSKAESGDKIWITPPTGNFIEPQQPSWWIASGTGIAPFLSWLRSGLKPPSKLIFGSREVDSLHFDEELSEICGGDYVRCISGEKVKDGFHGRVTDYLESCSELDQNQRYYLCGVAEMVIDAREILINRGVNPMLVHAEIYF